MDNITAGIATGPAPQDPTSSKHTRAGRSHSAAAVKGQQPQQPQASATLLLSPSSTSTSRPAGHRHSRSAHHHSHHLHHRSASRHETGLDTAAAPTESMSDLSKKLKGLREHTPSIHGSGHHHGHGHGLGHGHGFKKDKDKDVLAAAAAAESARGENREEQLAKWAEDQARENQRDECRNSEIRTALRNVSAFSTETTRLLDDIYYSILEKMSNVQSTISSLQELSNLTKNLRHGFEEDAIGIQRDVQDQLDTFGGFNTQKSRIESLEWRLKSSKETTETLTERLDAAHARLRGLETQEAEVQATISLRLRIFWGILGGILTTLLALLILHNFTPPTDYAGVGPFRLNSTSSGEPPVENKDNVSGLDGMSVASLSTPLSESTSPAYNQLEEDPRLRLFEEL